MKKNEDLKQRENGARNFSTDHENSLRRELASLFKLCPIPQNEVLHNLGVFLNRQTLGRILFMHELYSKIINVHGTIVEFGTRWGNNLLLFQSFRGIYEPFNWNRKVVGFDTFEGFTSVHEKDGTHELVKEGTLNVTPNYYEYMLIPLTQVDCFDMLTPCHDLDSRNH